MATIRGEYTENANGTGMIYVVTAVGATIGKGTHDVIIWSHAPHVDGPLDPSLDSLMRDILFWQDR